MDTPNPQDAPVAEVCYRHPDRPTGVTCQRCDRLICSQCMHQASVGVHCPECTKGASQKVYRADNLPGAQGTVTRALVGINVAVFLASIALLGATVSGAGQSGVDFGTWGPAITEDNEFWRIFTGGFMHSGILHIAFNMYLLWQLGQQLERVLGATKFLTVYFVALLGGSFGALLLDPAVPVVGASGAVFGLIGMTVLLYRSRGIGLFDTGLGFLIVINILYSFRGGVSLGGHAGGFIVGLILGAIYFGMNPGEGAMIPDSKKQMLITGVLGVVLFAAAIFAASTWMNPLF